VGRGYKYAHKIRGGSILAGLVSSDGVRMDIQQLLGLSGKERKI